MGKAHWATAGLLVVAAVIHNIETAKRVNKECLELLASINTVGKTLSRFSKLQVIPDEMKSTVTEAKTVIAKSAACCLSIIHSPILHKFIFSSKNEEQISSCAKRLEKLQHDLSFQLIFADYTERHELKKKKTLNEDEIISLPTSPHGGGNQPDGKTKDKRRTCFSRFDVICKKDGKRRTCNGILHRICKKDGQRPGSEHPSGKSSDAEKDSAVKIEEMLSLDSKEPAIAVFICGPWRTGKSRVADKVCSKLQRQLSKKNWKQIKIKITEVDTAEEGSVSNLDLVPGVRSKFLAKLQQTGNQKGTENIKEIESDNEWQKVVSRNLRDKSLKVFIYIDNVPSAEFLKKILPKKISEGNQMRLLVTIVDKNVASATEGSVFRKQLYVIRSLSYNQSLNFFAKKLPKEKTHTLVLRVIIKICEGYKTQMKMVRNYLMKYFGDDESFGRLTEWIKTEEPKFPKLMDYLSCEEQFNHQSAAIKEALLDICSFFSGWEWNKTACILDKDVLDKLKQLEMVKRESNKVCVPDKVMTYCLSRGKGTRITSATDLYAVPAEGKFHSIKGIWLVQNKCPIRISSQKLDEMPNLRVLALGDWTIVEGDCKKNFSNLRYFQAGRVEHLPFNISQLDNIRFMDNNSDRKMGISTLQVPPTLRMVRSKGSEFEHKLILDNYPIEYTLKLDNLPKECKVIELDIGGSNVDTLPNTVCELDALQKMILNKCRTLRSLPKSFGELRSLKMLDLSYCSTLSSLPSDFGWLSNLEKVNLSYCRNLKNLPESIGLLISIKKIDLSYCKRLMELPKSLVKLTTLLVLNLKACTYLMELPDGFEELVLKGLCLESCKRLKALPGKNGEIILLQKRVSLSWCLSIQELSKGFITFIKAHVEELNLVDCISLKSLPEDFPMELSGLKSLNLSGCRGLVCLPKRFHKLEHLQKLNLSSCENLEEPSTKLSRLPSLIEVNLSNCEGLKGHWLISLSKIQSLTFVDIHDSPQLVDTWNQMMKQNKIYHFTVATSRPPIVACLLSHVLSSDPYIKKLEQGSFNFFDGKWVFVDVNGRPFYSSTSLEEGKTVAVIFNHSYQKEELHALGEILDDLRASCKDMQVLQVSRFVSSLARELAGKHHVFSCDNYEAQVFFEEALSTVESFDQEMEYAMIISDVIRGPKQHKAFSTWMGITKNSLRAMTVEVPRAEYLRLKELTDTPQDSNIKLLQALLLTKEIDFLVTRTSQMGIKQLEGKFVFLLVSWLHDIEKESEDFKSVYDKLKGMLSMENKENFEAVWIPRVIHGRESRSLHAKGVEKIGFPSIADPWSINPVVMHLLRRRSTFNKLPLLLAVDPKGVLYLDNLIPETESIKKAVAIENATEALYNFLTERGSNSDKIQEEEDGPGS
ncbi:uncharacterized protein LOC131075899 isoform X1 [Cryptomeria japonica]|uniref:uncharacterized protein LOC131075899 isoform X1 n=1 Tax=Cryptomeria japonica TaxID=3369 RepID=UPI0027DA621E|nr:uncharacterized protein LOC131075899 isoform X1 [Cryptomeria japonica]